MYDYVGDINLEYGGMYIDLDGFNDGYADVIRITDLDSAMVWKGAILIESLTTDCSNDNKIKDSLKCCGLSDTKCDKRTKTGKLMIVESLIHYGHYDSNSIDYISPQKEILILTDDAEIEFDDWKADRRLSQTGFDSLESYIEAKWLD